MLSRSIARVQQVFMFIFPVMTSYIKELCTVNRSQLFFLYTFKNQLVLHVTATVAAISRYCI